MGRTFLGLTLWGSLVVALSGGCAQSNASAKTSGSDGSGTGEGGTNGGGGGASTTGGGGATGSGGATGHGGAAGAGGATGTGGSGSGTAADHPVISEIGVAPAGGEFVEIWNPTAAVVDLTDYYLSDNSAYAGIAAGTPWNPPTDNPGTDFLARFPKGTTLAPDAVLVVATDPTFKDTFGACPGFTLKGAFDGCPAPVLAMNAPTNGGIGDAAGLSNSREMVILFHWDGDAKHGVEDVDYVAWGADFDDATRVDKTGTGSYAADTPRASQKPALAPPPAQSIERCAAETGEKLQGGNGLTGHDETSEDLGTTFEVQATPTPGKKNACL
jgi:hypothetical protein